MSNSSGTIDADLSCAYCGNQAAKALVYCSRTKCWFCNGKAEMDQQSHAVMHAMQMFGQARYFLNETFKSYFEERSDISCYKCQNVNVFYLGYCKLGNGELRILCRYPCALNRRCRKWFPIIESESGLFINRIAEQPFLDTQIPLFQIENLEFGWWLEDDEDSTDVQLEKHPILFQDHQTYFHMFEKVVRLEHAEKKVDAKTRLSETDVTLQWINNSAMSKISFNLRASGLFKEGEKVVISRGGWEGIAVLLSCEGCNYTAVMNPSANMPIEETEGFKFQKYFDNVPFSRAMESLEHFLLRNPTDDIVQLILGVPVDRTYSSPNPRSLIIDGLPKPNGVQAKTIRHAFENPITIIEAPPGTGKTTVAAHLAYFYAKAGYRVLVCAPSNIAVDNVVLSLARTDVKDQLLRLYSTAVLSNPHYDRSGVLFEVSLEGKTDANNRTEMVIVKEASIVCCTCTMARDFKMKQQHFDVVIIDECSQAYEPEAMISVSKCTGRLILIGDSKQLGPLVKSQQVIKKGFNMTLFDRMGKIHEENSLVLNTQYRMHPAISEFPSFQFYDGNLTDGVEGFDRRFFLKDVSAGLWADDAKPIVFFDVGGRYKNREERAGTGRTFVNRLECKCLISVLHQLFEFGTEPCQVSVITMYSGQREYLRGFMKKLPCNHDQAEEADDLETKPGLSGDEDPPELGNRLLPGSRPESASSETEQYDNDSAIGRRKLAQFYATCKQVQIDTVDAYQGRENDIIIVSCVRSSQSSTIGFLSEPRRLNVALTRARCGLILIGDQETLARSSGIWQELVGHYNNETATRPSPVGDQIYDD